MQVNITGDSLPEIQATEFEHSLIEYQNSTSQEDFLRYSLASGAVEFELRFPTYKYDPLTTYQQMY